VTILGGLPPATVRGANVGTPVGVPCADSRAQRVVKWYKEFPEVEFVAVSRRIDVWSQNSFKEDVLMSEKPVLPSVSRRKFLVSSSSLVAATPVISSLASRAEGTATSPALPRRQPPLAGFPSACFDNEYAQISTDQLLDKLSSLRV